MNPNFPANLAITPSLGPFEFTEDVTFGARAQRNSIQRFGIAGRVWEAAYALNIYVENGADWEFNPPFFIPGPDSGTDGLTILELGSGTGLSSSKIAKKLTLPGRDILIATDLPDVCPLLRKNLQLNEEHHPIPKCLPLVRPLAWGNREHAIAISDELSSLSTPRYLTHIICSDLVYFPELLAPLLRTLIQLSSPPFVPPSESQSNSPTDDSLTITISYKIRSFAKELPFWSAFGLWFTFEPVLARSRKTENSTWRRFGSSAEGHTFVFIAHRRPQSFAWEVPENNTDLLGGVGAYGTRTKKGDDTFELLLLMALDEDEEE